ncbi:MAG: hypothetical protein ACYCS7_15680 [Acidimicrobiales bacterium]
MANVELNGIQQQDGPCLDCWRFGGTIRQERLNQAQDHRWPRFTPAALAAGFRAAYALPLRLPGQRLGGPQSVYR